MKGLRSCLVVLAAMYSKVAVAALNLNLEQGSKCSSNSIARRDLFRKSLSVAFGGAIATATVGTLTRQPSLAAVIDFPERQSLFKAINSGANDATVLQCLDDLLLLRTSNDKATLSPDVVTTTSTSKPLLDRLDGRWKLIWSFNDQVSPLLKLPRPFKPTSYQYAGSAAAPIVGEGRIAQMLTDGVLGTSKAWLSSGIVVRDEHESMLEIRPPFRLELETNSQQPRKVLVDAGSDADFRAVNARTADAQRAPPNLYQQVYVEDDGPGSLRVSKIVDGDPVIVGATLIHIKL
jgi:hypothetical protein